MVLALSIIGEALVFPTLPNERCLEGASVSQQPYTVLGIRWLVKVLVLPAEVIMHLLYMIAIPLALIWAAVVVACVTFFLIALGLQFIGSGTVPDPIPYLAIPAMKWN